MKQILSLLGSDYWELRRWFQNERAGKLFVVLGFLLIVSLITSVLYGGSSIFFRGLARYETFGLLSSQYLFHAGFIILFGLVTVLSAVSFCTFLYASKRKINSLLVLPLSSYVIPGWLFFRELSVSCILFVFFLTPVSISFYRYFGQTDIIYYTLMYSAVLFVLAMATSLVGMGLGLLCCMSFQKSKKTTLAFLLFLMIITGYICMQLIFPPQLKTLYNASPGEFESIYYSLPLSHPYLPSGWLIKGITIGNIFYILPFFSASALLLVGIGTFASRNFIGLYRSLYDRPFTQTTKQEFDKRLLTIQWPLMYKDLLGIIRVPQEVGYGIFLIVLTMVFFLFLLFARQFRSETYQGGEYQFLFYFIAYLFYTVAYTLRMIFPLMAKEGRATWHIFSLPLTRGKILQDKVFVSLILLLPFIIGSFALWMVVSLGSGISMGIYTSLVILSLGISSVSLGAIHPNFAESENAEKISTSGMGILMLFLALIIIALGSFSLNLYVSGQQPLWLMLLFAACLVGGNIFLYSAAKRAVRNYQF